MWSMDRGGHVVLGLFAMEENESVLGIQEVQDPLDNEEQMEETLDVDPVETLPLEAKADQDAPHSHANVPATEQGHDDTGAPPPSPRTIIFEQCAR